MVKKGIRLRYWYESILFVGYRVSREYYETKTTRDLDPLQKIDVRILLGSVLSRHAGRGECSGPH